MTKPTKKQPESEKKVVHPVTEDSQPVVSDFSSRESMLYHYLKQAQPNFYHELLLNDEVEDYLKLKAREMEIREHELFQSLLAQQQDSMLTLDLLERTTKMERLKQEARATIQQSFMP